MAEWTYDNKDEETGYDTTSVYLNGQVGAWAPLHPQWQHWGALWFTDEDMSEI